MVHLRNAGVSECRPKVVNAVTPSAQTPNLALENQHAVRRDQVEQGSLLAFGPDFVELAQPELLLCLKGGDKKRDVGVRLRGLDPVR